MTTPPTVAALTTLEAIRMLVETLEGIEADCVAWDRGQTHHEACTHFSCRAARALAAWRDRLPLVDDAGLVEATSNVVCDADSYPSRTDYRAARAALRVLDELLGGGE